MDIRYKKAESCESKALSELVCHLVFRDALERDPGARQRYEAIKKEIESRADGDRKLYARLKEREAVCRAFVESVLKNSGRIAEGRSADHNVREEKE